MNISRGRRLRRVHIGVRVKPNQSRLLISFSTIGGKAGDRPNRDRMIPAKNQRQFAGSQNPFSFPRQVLAGMANLAKMFKLVARVWRSLFFFNLQVAEVTDFIAKLSDPPIEFRNSERGWTEFDTCHAGTIGQRHANNANAFTLSWEEGLHEARKGCEITSLNQDLSGSTEFRNDAFPAYDAAKESGSRFAQGILRRSFPGHQA